MLGISKPRKEGECPCEDCPAWLMEKPRQINFELQAIAKVLEREEW